MHDIVMKREKQYNFVGVCVESMLLCETEVLASGGDGCENLLTEYLVALVFGKIKLWNSISR